ncbi:MAG TPA: hypothetical protein PLD62_05610 [Candidatus Cloacimonadota bacterium]|nr:hypothetical protein [Candidatus Cloacimonadota bacterium]
MIYNKIKSYRADYDRVYNYDTIGRPYEYFDVYEKVATSVLSFPVSYQAFDFLRLGVGVNINIYHAETSRVCLNDEYLYEHFNGEIDFVLFRPKLGAVARFNDHISVGTTLILPSSKRIKECVFWKEIKYEKNAFPLEFGFGSKIDLGWIPLSLLVDYNYSNEAANREFVDSHQAGIGLECGILPSLQLRTGYLYQNDFRDLDYLEDGSCFWCDNTSYEQMFFTGGATFRWRKTSWDVAVMQSGFTSDLSQTYFKMGVTLDLEQR